MHSLDQAHLLQRPFLKAINITTPNYFSMFSTSNLSFRDHVEQNGFVYFPNDRQQASHVKVINLPDWSSTTQLHKIQIPEEVRNPMWKNNCQHNTNISLKMDFCFRNFTDHFIASSSNEKCVWEETV